jgi:hypothetical protein
LFSQLDNAFSQSRTAQRARNLAYGLLNCNTKHTLTGLLTASGEQFKDWSSSYRLFKEERMDLDEFFSVIKEKLIKEHLSQDQAIYAHMDDTVFKKTGRKVSGTAWRRDPLGPPFHTNFLWGQRFLQLSIALPDNQGASISRAIPVDFHHCPTAKKPRKNDSKEAWDEYKEAKKQTNLSLKGVQRIKKLRKCIDDMGAKDRQLIVSVDGSYTNRTVMKNIPERVTIIGRIRKDSRIYSLPEEKQTKGRKRIYGELLPTPEQIRKDDNIPWQQVEAYAAGKVHSFNVKILKNIRWRASSSNNVQLVIISPLAYRLTKNSRLLYRKPAYLICTDPNLEIEKLLQAYLWRWEIEVNFKEEKSLFGSGEAQVRNIDAVEKVPGFIVAIYALLLLAAYRTNEYDFINRLPRAKWYPNKKSVRTSTGDILNVIRAQLFARAIELNFSHFVNLQYKYTNSKNLMIPLFSNAFYNRN